MNLTRLPIEKEKEKRPSKSFFVQKEKKKQPPPAHVNA
jgi:hypothetical protein